MSSTLLLRHGLRVISLKITREGAREILAHVSPGATLARLLLGRQKMGPGAYFHSLHACCTQVQLRGLPPKRADMLGKMYCLYPSSCCPLNWRLAVTRP